jgi:hypothetical protein
LKNAQNPFVRQSLGGWSFAPIFTAYTGNPYTIYDCSNAHFARCPRMFAGSITTVNGNPTPAGSPNLFNWMTVPTSVDFTSSNPAGCNIAGSLNTFSSYLDPLTCTGEFPTNGKWPASMTGRNLFRGPGFWNMDAGIYKKFKLTERFNLQIRGEMYNMFNHHPFAMIGGNNDVSAGITSTTAKKIGNRDVQLGAKVTF